MIDREPYEVLVYAHRGGRKWAPENTMSAFRKSLEHGADGIELDVQRCSSGELVVFHDHTLERTTNGVGQLSDCSLDELRRLSAGAWFDQEFEEERIPTLQEVLNLVDGQVLLNVEIKNMPVYYENIEDDVIEMLEGYSHQDRIIISSFDNRLVKRIHQRKPEWNFATLMVGIPADLVEHCHQIGAKYWHPEFESILPDALEEARAAGISTNCWTVNDERDWVRVLKDGVDGIITDDPEELINFLKLVREHCE